MFPEPDLDQKALWRAMTRPDQYGARLWDIEPLTQVGGLGHDGEIIHDRCRGISIRWKAFPQMKYKREFGLRRLIAELTLRSGAYTSTVGLALIVNYSISYISEMQRDNQNQREDRSENAEEVKDLFFIAIRILLLFFSILLAQIAPVAVRKLFSGKITESAP